MASFPLLGHIILTITYVLPLHSEILHTKHVRQSDSISDVVTAELPRIIKKPSVVTKAAEGQSVELKCSVFGTPTPFVIWRYARYGDNFLEVDGPRFTVHQPDDTIANLRIANLQKSDEGTYRCNAVNGFGTISAQGHLIVRDRTTITVGPEDQTVNAYSDVVFECQARTDPRELINLRIEWRRNGVKIDYHRESRLKLNIRANSLLIKKANTEDAGRYTCVASNGLDMDGWTALLTVKGVSEDCQVVTEVVLHERERIKAKLGDDPQGWRFELLRTLVESHTSGIDINDDRQVESVVCQLVSVETLTEAIDAIALEGIPIELLQQAYSEYVNYVMALKLGEEWETLTNLYGVYDYLMDVGASQNLSINVKFGEWDYEKEDHLVESNFLEQLQAHFTTDEIEEILSHIVHTFGNDFMNTLAKLVPDAGFDYFLGTTIPDNRLGDIAEAFWESHTAEELARNLDIPVHAAKVLTETLPWIVQHRSRSIEHNKQEILNGKALEEHSNLLHLELE